MARWERRACRAEDQWSRYTVHSAGGCKDEARGRARKVLTVRCAFPCLGSGAHRQTGARDHGPGASQNQNQNLLPNPPPPRALEGVRDAVRVRSNYYVRWEQPARSAKSKVESGKSGKESYSHSQDNHLQR